MTTTFSVGRWCVALAAVLVLICAIPSLAQPGRGYGDRRSGGGDSGERREGGDRRDRGPGGMRFEFNRGGGDERRGSATPSNGSQGNGSSGAGSSRNSGTKPNMGVQSFGSQDKNRPQAPGFNVPLEVPGGNLQDRYDKRVIERADKEVMPRFDRDKDGFLSLEESKETTWDPPFETSDIDKDGRLSHFELYERYAKKMNLPPKTAVVYNTATGVGKPAEASGSSSADQAKILEHAKGMVAQHDTNKNGVLDKEEWAGLNERHHSADTNGDKVITADELAVRLAAYANSSSTPSSGSSQPQSSSYGQGRGRGNYGRGSDSVRSTEKVDSRKSYRVPTATERLPKGLPDWFARNDTDADGQVAMAEYMTEFTESKASEFAKYDLDGDGIITPFECLDVDGKTKKK